MTSGFTLQYDYVTRYTSYGIGDMPMLAAWMVESPLWQRYGLTIPKAISSFEGGLARGDWLIVCGR